jgi:hypothetical protein
METANTDEELEKKTSKNPENEELVCSFSFQICLVSVSSMAD